MRPLILRMSMSLDGFVAGPDGQTDWIFGPDQGAKAWVVDAVSNASLHIMGSRTFADMAAFWPRATGPFAAPMNQIPKAVFSRQGQVVLNAAVAARSLGDTQPAPLQPGADSWEKAHVAGGDLAEEIARLKAGDGKPIVAHGGARFARSLIARDLVDEYRLMVVPIALGKGLPIFAGLSAPTRLELVSAKVFPGGAVAQVYRPA